MLPDTELLCDLRDGMTLCDANSWHLVFLIQSVLVVSLGLVNAGTGVRYFAGVLTTPLWLARRFAWGTLGATLVPLVTGLGLREQVKSASYACYLHHAETGCTHSLVDRGREMAAVFGWIGWTEGVLLGTCVLALGLLYGSRRA
ncbi:MAG: hypothetical protein ABMB14_03800 [Myxococcota bacterium]